MGAPIRSAEEITQIINRGQHAIASLGLEIVQEAKRGADNNDPDWRWKQMRLILLRSFYQNILTVDGTINNFYAASLNEKAENNILTGILKLSGIYSGPAIPKLTGDNLPMYFFPSSSGVSTGGNSGGAATPGGITFEALDVDAPGEVVDRIEANGSNYAFYIVNVYGNGGGEGSKGAVLLVTWRGASTPVVTEYGGADVGGTTAGVTFSAALVSGFIELTANVPTDNWTIRGTRISFQNISFQNPLGPMPAGGTIGQYLRKSSNLDYATEWSTLLWQYITDVTASLAEINRVAGVTSPIQTQINTILSTFLALAGGTMAGAIAMGNNKITGLSAATANGDALRYEQLIGLYLLLTGGTMSGNIAMGGNKVTGLAAATNPGEAVRYEQLPTLLSTTIQIGTWDMTSGIKNVAHGIADYQKIRSVSVIIRNDAENQLVDLLTNGYGGSESSAGIGGYFVVQSTNVVLFAGTGCFNSALFDDGVIERGWVTIEYEA